LHGRGVHSGQRVGAMRQAIVLAVLLVLLPVAAQDPSAVDSPLPAASIVEGWGRVGRGAAAREGAPGGPRGSVPGRTHGDPTVPSPLDSIWEGLVAPSQRTINSQVERVLQTSVTAGAAAKDGPKQEPSPKASSVRGRQGSPARPAVPGPKSSTVGEEEKTTDGTTYVDYKNGRVYLSEKPMAKEAVPVRRTHMQKMMSMAHANMDAIARKDKLFADKLRKEAKELSAAGMAAEGTVRPCVVQSDAACSVALCLSSREEIRRRWSARHGTCLTSCKG